MLQFGTSCCYEGEGRTSDIYVPDNKPFFRSLESPQVQVVRACGLSAPVQWTQVRSEKTVVQVATNTHIFFNTACFNVPCLCTKRRSICVCENQATAEIRSWFQYTLKSSEFVVWSTAGWAAVRPQSSRTKDEGHQSQLIFMLNYYIDWMQHVSV